MSFYYRGWAPYVSVAERRHKAEAEIKKLSKNGALISPVKIDGRKIAKTFWGKAWCDNLESYRDYENRLPRGRSYVRNGSVLDLQIAPREVRAMVSGSALYQVKVSIGDVNKAHWEKLCADCSGGIDSLVELLQGRFSKGVMERLCRQDTGLFPRPSEIRFTCSCPDYASMCKHIAAVLYGVGARFDESPELLFKLRAVEATELLSNLGAALPATKTQHDETSPLADADLAALFGLDMAEDALPTLPPKTVTSSLTQKPTSKDAAMPSSPGSTSAVKANTAKPAVKARSAAAPIKGKPKTAKSATKLELTTPTSKTTQKLTKPAANAAAKGKKAVTSSRMQKPARKNATTPSSPAPAPTSAVKAKTAKPAVKARLAAAPIKGKPKTAKSATKLELTAPTSKTTRAPAKPAAHDTAKGKKAVASPRTQKPARKNATMPSSPGSTSAVKTKTAKPAVKARSAAASIKGKPKAAKSARKLELTAPTSKTAQKLEKPAAHDAAKGKKAKPVPPAKGTKPMPAKPVWKAKAAPNQPADNRTAKASTKTKRTKAA